MNGFDTESALLPVKPPARKSEASNCGTNPMLAECLSRIGYLEPLTQELEN